MRCFVVCALISVILISCNAAPKSSAQSEYQDPNSIALAESEKTITVVDSYYAVMLLASKIDPILTDSAISSEKAIANEVEFTKYISEANKLFNLAISRHEKLAPIDANLTGYSLEAASDVRALIPEIRNAANQTISVWQNQFNALKVGDIEEYERLISTQVDQSVLLIEMTNVSGKATLLTINPNSPGYHIQDSIVVGNEVIIGFMKFLNSYETNSKQEDQNMTDKLVETVNSLEQTIQTGMSKVDSQRLTLKKNPDKKVRKLGIAYLDCTSDSLRREKKILSNMKVYRDFALEIISGEYSQESQNRLEKAEIQIRNDSLERSESKTKCYNLALAYNQYIKAE